MTSAEHSAAMEEFEERTKRIHALWYRIGADKARREIEFGYKAPGQSERGRSHVQWWRGYSETWAKESAK